LVVPLALAAAVATFPIVQRSDIFSWRSGEPLLLGGRPVEAWIREIQAPSADQRARAVDEFGDALIDAGDVGRFASAVPALIDRLSDEDSAVRFYAAWTLQLFERDALPAVEELADRVRSDADPEVRVVALESLAKVASPPGAFAEALFGRERTKTPPDPDPQRSRATSDAALAVVEQALQDEAPEVRKEAVSAIGRWGRDGKHMAAKVAPFIQDADPGTRYVAVYTSGLIDAPADVVLTGLISVLEEPLPRYLHKDPRPSTKRMALTQIREFGADARRAIPTLRALRDDPHVSREVRETLLSLEAGAK
jgi:HEAT repeat protein